MAILGIKDPIRIARTMDIKQAGKHAEARVDNCICHCSKF